MNDHKGGDRANITESCRVAIGINIALIPMYSWRDTTHNICQAKTTTGPTPAGRKIDDAKAGQRLLRFLTSYQGLKNTVI